MITQTEGKRMTTKTKVQCWEFMKCHRESNRSCPAVVQSAGRSCWLVAGTLCGGKVQGAHAEKIESCKTCNFYIKIKKKEI
jgi:methyl-accepting chemotaxis protein